MENCNAEISGVNVAYTDYKPPKWYKHPAFPLIPLLERRPGNEYNTSSFTFQWLLFKIWSLDSFDFDISFVLTSHWGLGVTAILPYLRIVACIPMPQKWSNWIYENLWRKPKQIKK